MSIERLLEFMGNHPFLFMALGATVGFIVFTEYMRYAGGVKGLSPYQATQLMNDGETLFVDVRDDSEFKKGHVLDALNIPLGSMDKRVHELEKYKEKEVVLYCDTGMRSQRASAKLKKGGFNKLHNLSGGCLLYTSPSPRDRQKSRMPSSA